LMPLLLLLGVKLTMYFLFVPVIILLEFALVFGLSLSLSSLNVLYRDFHQVWDIVTQLGFFLSPIIYQASRIPPRFQFAYSLNPITRIIESAHDVFLQSSLPSAYDIEVPLAFILGFLILGFLVFRSLEQRFSEEL